MTDLLHLPRRELVDLCNEVADVWREMERRERLFGIAEKLKAQPPPKERRKVAAATVRQARRRS